MAAVYPRPRRLARCASFERGADYRHAVDATQVPVAGIGEFAIVVLIASLVLKPL
jgi:hypothetical protein